MGKGLMGEGLGLKPWFQGLTPNLKIRENTTKNAQETLETLKASQLELELKSQAQHLDEQITEMGVSKDAMNKFSKFGLGLTKIMIFAILAYGAKKAVDYGLNGIDQGSQQEEVVNDTQENIQHAFVIDTAAIIDYYKETLSKDELEEFEQFSKEEQRRFATEK